MKIKRNNMEIKEIVELIRIGLDKPKFYKRSTWNKAIKVMDFLLDNTKEISKTNMSMGLEKYKSNVEVTEEKLNIWAQQYKRGLGLTIDEAIPKLSSIANNLGVNINNGIVIKEYFKK